MTLSIDRKELCKKLTGWEERTEEMNGGSEGKFWHNLPLKSVSKMMRWVSEEEGRDSDMAAGGQSKVSDRRECILGRGDGGVGSSSQGHAYTHTAVAERLLESKQWGNKRRGSWELALRTLLRNGKSALLCFLLRHIYLIPRSWSCLCCLCVCVRVWGSWFLFVFRLSY